MQSGGGRASHPDPRRLVEGTMARRDSGFRPSSRRSLSFLFRSCRSSSSPTLATAWVSAPSPGFIEPPKVASRDRV
eukprot:scaffold1885_cov402-Prasinococcus_capsulatus_cf.AAC.14